MKTARAKIKSPSKNAKPRRKSASAKKGLARARSSTKTATSKTAEKTRRAANEVEFFISAARFGYTLHFEFLPAGSTQKYGISLKSVSVNPNSDRFGELMIQCPNLPQFGISDIQLLGAPVANGARNYGVTIQCQIPGFKPGDIFRVKSAPLDGNNSAPNLNASAQIQLRYRNSTLVNIPNGVGFGWVSYPISALL